MEKIFCDKCGKETDISSFYLSGNFGFMMFKKYKVFRLCSKTCFLEMVSKLFKETVIIEQKGK